LFSAAGTQGDGVITLVLGAVLAAVGFINLDRVPTSATRLLMLIAAGVSVAIYAYAFSNVSNASSGTLLRISVGSGIYVGGLGAVVAAIAAWRMPTENQGTPPSSPVKETGIRALPLPARLLLAVGVLALITVVLLVIGQLAR
jgi:hypothetical protein